MTFYTCAHSLIPIELVTFGLSMSAFHAFAGGIDDGCVIFEHQVREMVGSQILPDVLDYYPAVDCEAINGSEGTVRVTSTAAE